MHIQTSLQPELSLGLRDYTCNWGAHIAGLYETPQERDEIIFGFLERGARDGDLQLYCPTEWTRGGFVQEMRARCPHCDPEDEARFRLYDARALYYPDGTFDPRAMDEGLEAFFEESQSGGPRNIRAAAEMIWALEAVPGREHLFAYEARLNYFIAGKPWVSICLYNINRFTGGAIMDVLRTHPYTISKGILTENPYYQDPGDWLRENAPEFLIPPRG